MTAESTGDSQACQQSDWCGPGSHCLCVRADTNDSRETCPTLCDDDCEADCHEFHQPYWKREHVAEACAAPHAEGSTDTHPASAGAHGAAQGADDGV